MFYKTYHSRILITDPRSSLKEKNRLGILKSARDDSSSVQAGEGIEVWEEVVTQFFEAVHCVACIFPRLSLISLIDSIFMNC